MAGKILPYTIHCIVLKSHAAIVQ